ncbi:phage tail protein [Streptomyces sp. NPDC092307]|uniref:phage tail protein n=1 Tax=Streptomyces sp. NPDC092307 TaxID=3366013 RepID=UPI0037F3CF0C
MDCTLTNNAFTIDLGRFQVDTCQSVDGLTIGQDTIEIRQVTASGELVICKQPGARQAGEVTITRGLNGNTAFTDWVNETLQRHSPSTARQNVTITLIDSMKQPVRRYQLINAWATSWQGPSLQAGDSTAATETITLTYEDCTVE